MSKVKVAILGSGNIGTDLMYKILKRPNQMELCLVAGIDADSDGLARARDAGIATSADSIEAVLESGAQIVFDATSARAHKANAPRMAEKNQFAIDLTPAAIGPYVVPPVNGAEHLQQKNVNLISCGAQASIPLIYAASRVMEVEYAELITATASKSVGPGTRANLDEFSETTSMAIKEVGDVKVGRALPVVNPAEPPINMTNSVYLVPTADEVDLAAITASVEQMIASVQEYVPGYRLTADPVIDHRDTPWGKKPVVVLLNQIEGAGDYLPTYAGNLDIITAAAWRVANAYATGLQA